MERNPVDGKPSTTTCTTSGAASRIACSTMVFSASGDDPQPCPELWTLTRTTASEMPINSALPLCLRSCGRSILDGAGHALFERYGMSSVEHQKSADQRIIAELGQRSATGLAGVEQLDDAGDDGTVQIHHRLEEFERGGARIFVGEGGDALHQLLNALGVRLELTVAVAVICRPPDRTSASAGPLTLCRLPGTCARRRAGTDQSCAPPA